MPKPRPFAPAQNSASEQADEQFSRLFGSAAGPVVKALLIRAGTLSGADVEALSLRWRPSLDFLAAQAAAWKVARKVKLSGPADFAYNAAYAAVPHIHPDWARAANVAAHAALGKALAGRLAPASVAILVAGWDETVAPLPEPSVSPVRVRVRHRDEAGSPGPE